ncbi:uncharacterized protein LOC141607796 [Silene latifolia]|uniref:uncharacterized protein LOC141607796 n=1 Tax=Silene latifolia TaxID=37657 RepID=UPI003D774FC9
MSKQTNTTLLALIPKKPVVATVMDYIPIAYCTVFYKTVSKILYSRLKPFLPDIVGKEQGAFVKGRSIFENIMLTQSLHFHFPAKFRKWIKGCITSTWFSLKVNGDHVGFFKGASGLRQGDPLSPFLGDVPSVRAITSSLDSFAKMSGLIANPDKTNIYMGGIRENIKQEILNATGYREGDFSFRYLGVPLNEGRLNKPMFTDLLTKVQGALNYWTTYKLSYAGKISLINSVIFGLEQFWGISGLCKRKAHIQSVGGAYCRQRGNNLSWTKAAWNRDLLPKHSFFLVMAMQRKLATIDQLNIRGLYMRQVLTWLNVHNRTVKLSKEMHWIAGRRACKHWKAIWYSSCL